MPRAAIDIAGKRFGRLLVLGRATVIAEEAYWLVVCDCGAQRSVTGNSLRSGKTRSCGCLKLDLLNSEEWSKRFTSHGHAKHKSGPSRTYASWTSMKARCGNPNDPYYHLYGGRGITVCAQWLDSFETFLSDMGERPLERTLDRIDGNDGYHPNNCRWATMKEQSDNTKRLKGSRHPKAKLNECDVQNIRVEYTKGGLTHQDLANFYGVAVRTIGVAIRGNTWKHM